MSKDDIIRTTTSTSTSRDDATTQPHNCFSNAPRRITVTVYLESSSPPPRLHTSSSTKLPKRTSRFYDRRANLLAYSRQLRASTSRDPILTAVSQSKPRRAKKLHNAFTRVVRKDRAQRYERIETDGIGKRRQWCHPRSMTCNKAKTRIGHLFKNLWRGCCRWKCNKVKLQQSKW